MSRLTRLLGLLPILAAHACLSSSLVLHVTPNGSGHAVITSRVFESSVRAFDSLFPEKPAGVVKIEELLPAPGEGQLERQFGARVRLASTKLDKAADGGIRTTIVDFDDVTQLRLTFPPIFDVPSDASFGILGGMDPPLVTFATKPHENGDRLLLVKMPDPRMTPDPDPQMTKFETDSAEERALKRAIKGLAVSFVVEIEPPLLRTNAPASGAHRATIIDLDLDKMINAMDEPMVRRMMSPGSFQEMLWQIGDLPGAVVPVDHEIFLEYEAPAVQQQPAAAAPPQAPPDTEIYLAPLKVTNGALTVGPAIDITNNPGYDNQPFFTPDGKAILFTSVRGGGTQTDIYRYDIGTTRIAQVTKTPESEYSPTVTPDGNLSVVRVELDGNNTQRLWQFTLDGRDPRVVLENVKPVGYHAWADNTTLALFVLGQPATLQLADTRTGAVSVIASDIGRSIARMPPAAAAPGNPHAISFVQRERRGDLVNLTINELNPSTRATSLLTSAVIGSTEADCAWTPDGTLLMVRGTTLYGWKRGQAAWSEVASLEQLSLAGVTRLAVSPKGDYLALVGRPRQSR